jgi:hypothetical protein
MILGSFNHAQILLVSSDHAILPVLYLSRVQILSVYQKRTQFLLNHYGHFPVSLDRAILELLYLNHVQILPVYQKRAQTLPGHLNHYNHLHSLKMASFRLNNGSGYRVQCGYGGSEDGNVPSL